MFFASVPPKKCRRLSRHQASTVSIACTRGSTATGGVDGPRTRPEARLAAGGRFDALGGGGRPRGEPYPGWGGPGGGGLARPAPPPRAPPPPLPPERMRG